MSGLFDLTDAEILDACAEELRCQWCTLNVRIERVPPDVNVIASHEAHCALALDRAWNMPTSDH